VSEASFIGMAAEIVTGEAVKGQPAEARLVDRFGQAHYVRVEPNSADERFVRGMRVAIVARKSESLYIARALPRHDSLP
jgi:hypothetical protein